MLNIVMLDRNSLPSSFNLDCFTPAASWLEYDNTNQSQLVERCANADVVVLSKVVINAELLDQCPRIKHIAIAATGYNVIDIDACNQHGVTVSNIPSYAATTVAEHVINVSLSLRRQLEQYRQLVIQGAWQTAPAFCLFDKPIHGLNGATMGIIGLGEIGKKTAELASAMGMKVVFCARRAIQHKYAQQVTIKELLASSDIVSLHCGLNAETKNMIGSTEISVMKANAILINTARGGIVDEGALRDAIINNKIGGAAFDVLVEEPPKTHSPLLEIADRPNVIITPHISWTSQQALQHLIDVLKDNINAFLQNNPKNLVN